MPDTVLSNFTWIFSFNFHNYLITQKLLLITIEKAEKLSLPDLDKLAQGHAAVIATD